MNKFWLVLAFAATFTMFSACGGKAESHEGEAKTEEKAPESAASIEGKWTLSDVVLDLESLPKEMKDKMNADPKSKEKMDEGIKKMIEEGMSFEFMSGGAAKITLRGKEEEGKYEYKDKVLTLTDKKGPKALNVTELTANTMAFVMEEGGLKMNMKFKK